MCYNAISVICPIRQTGQIGCQCDTIMETYRTALHENGGYSFMKQKNRVDSKRAQTMRERLGSASELCNNDQYLPRARAVQMSLNSAEWETLVKMARRADNPAHYFMKLISKANFERTMEAVHKLMNKLIDIAAIAAKKVQKAVKFAAKVAEVQTRPTKNTGSASIPSATSQTTAGVISLGDGFASYIANRQRLGI